MAQPTSRDNMAAAFSDARGGGTGGVTPVPGGAPPDGTAASSEGAPLTCPNCGAQLRVTQDAAAGTVATPPMGGGAPAMPPPA